MNKSPHTVITVYRGAPKIQKQINPGDFITTNKQLAQLYAGMGHVIEKQVRLGDILDNKDEPLGEEYLYRPGAHKEIFGDINTFSQKNRENKGKRTPSKENKNLSKDEYIKYHTFQIVDERKWEGKLTGATIKLEDGELKFSIDREDDETIMIIDIVEAKTPRKGIGTKLMKKAEQIADNEGVDRIEL